MTILRDQEDALTSTDGARALVSSMNKEIRNLKKTIVTTQNELESWRTQYHAADKSVTVLTTKLDVFVGIEVIKFALSAVGVSWGVNYATDGKGVGYIIMAASAVLYIVITWWQRSK